MVYESIQGLPLNIFDKILLVVLEKHMINNTLINLNNQFEEYSNFEILILENETSSASETVSQAIEKKNITGEIYIKDSDSYFNVTHLKPNQICTFSLDNIENITPGNKSYVRKNENNEILTIVEKRIISTNFCCGLYSFESAEEFVKTFKNLSSKISGEIFISHIIYKMLLDGKIFITNNAENFIDWGTQKDWDIFKMNYKNKRIQFDR